MSSGRFSRQELFVSKEGQKKIASSSVAIVGLGGTGSLIAQSLAYLGVQNYILIDDDHVEESNLNRLIGAYPEDLEEETKKVDVAERLIHKINPEAKVNKIFNNLRSREALEVLTTSPIIFGCVDNQGARLILLELAAAFENILIDMATEIFPENGHYGGRVIISIPGKYCLLCAGQMDAEEAKQDLESNKARESRLAHGYGLEKVTAPAVVSINGVIANIAITEFLAIVTGMREPTLHLTYKAERGIVTTRIINENDACFVCGYLVGKKEEADIYKYSLD